MEESVFHNTSVQFIQLSSNSRNFVSLRGHRNLHINWEIFNNLFLITKFLKIDYVLLKV